MFSKKKNSDISEHLLEELENSRILMNTAFSNFEAVVDPDLIDYYIYKAKAEEHRYQFLLRQLKTEAPGY